MSEGSNVTEMPSGLTSEERLAWADEHAPSITAALRFGASDEIEANDIHFRSGHHPWVQIGGLLEPVTDLAMPSDSELLHAIEWAGGPEVSNTVVCPTETHQRWRAQTLEDHNGPALTTRRLSTKQPTFKLLGPNLDKARDIAVMSEGLVIVSGATGSGKTTTLAAIIDMINQTRACHIYSIESPIEYVYAPHKAIFTQREVGLHVETAAEGFHSALRSAPDVILLGELRTEEEADLCLEAAMSGHLVMTTMHARDVGTVCERIIGNKGKLGASKLAQAFRMSISQRLLPARTNPRSRHVYAEVVPRDSAIVNLMRDNNVSKIGDHVRDTLDGGVDGQLAFGVSSGEISELVGESASVKSKEFNERLERLGGPYRDGPGKDDGW